MSEATTIKPPDGAYVELDLDLIDEGKFKTHFEAKLRAALEGLLAYEKESFDLTGAATITVKVKLERQKGSQQFMDISYGAKSDVPVVTRGTQVRLAGDRLLCQPAGSNEGSPDQQLFYDAKGNIICDGHGEIPPVAGKIAKRA